MAAEGALSRVHDGLGALLRAADEHPRPVRLACAATLVVTGISLAVPNAVVSVQPDTPPVGLVLGAVGTLVSLGVVVAGVLIPVRSTVPSNAVRIAAWTAAGVGVLGTAVGLLLHYQTRMGGRTADPAFVAANVLAIGAGAHVVVGVYDSRRVRTSRLARERRRVAVLNRVLRHNLRNEATVLALHAELLREQGGLETGHRSIEAVTDASDTLAGLADGAKEITAALEREGERLETVDAAALAREAIAETDAGVELDAPEACFARGATGVRAAIARLVENAVVHGEPPVSVTVAREDEWVVVRVTDEGPGIPEDERAVAAGEVEITQLSHGTGLGLWVAKTIAECYRGQLVFEEPDAGTSVALRLRAA